MHAIHRSPGNGVRCNSEGIGGLAAARILPEGSVRAHGLYNSECQNLNRCFGNGPPKPYPPLQPPSCRGDIFMEAGRLAAEYLVSRGVLTPNVLARKWHNGSLKSQIGYFQEFRAQSRENLQLPSEGRTSALARLGNAVPDVGSGRRRFPDDFNPTGSRNHTRGRRRMEYVRGYGSDWGRENGRRNGLWSENARTSTDIEGEDDFVSEYREEQRINLDGSGGFLKTISNELPVKCDIVGDPESELENHACPDDMGLSTSPSCTRKELTVEANGEFSKGSANTKILDLEIEEVKAGNSIDEMKKQGALEDFTMQHSSMEGDSVNKNGNDLLRLCGFAKLPTKTRSSLTYKVSKVDPVPMTGRENTNNIDLQEGPKVPIEPVQSPISALLTNQTHSSICFESDISRAPSVESLKDVVDLDAGYAVERRECLMPQSFPDRSFMYEQASGQAPPELGRCGFTVKERSVKRALQNDDTREGTKKPRECPSATVTHGDEYFQFRTFSGKPSNSHEESLSPNEGMVEAVDQERLLDTAFFPEGESELDIGFKKEKQLFPSSFNICDLNLMVASDITESHGSDPILGLPCILEAKMEAPMNVDLSVSNKCNRSDGYDRSLADAEEAAADDVANDSTKEEKAVVDSSEKTETVHSSLESFPNLMESTGDIPDVQDGYGLMISELLGTDISNCPSESADITSLHTEMGLHSGAGILGDDDPIYLWEKYQ